MLLSNTRNCVRKFLSGQFWHYKGAWHLILLTLDIAPSLQASNSLTPECARGSVSWKLSSKPEQILIQQLESQRQSLHFTGSWHLITRRNRDFVAKVVDHVPKANIWLQQDRGPLTPIVSCLGIPSLPLTKLVCHFPLWRLLRLSRKHTDNLMI